MNRPPDQADANLIADVLDSGADQRKRTAVRAAEAVAAMDKDPRSAAVRVTRMLAEAGRLEALAKGFRDGSLVIIETATSAAVALAALNATVTAIENPDDVTPVDGVDTIVDQDPEDVTGDEDDGLSAAAHAAAEAAGLTPTIITDDAIEEDELGALPEDEPAPDEVATVTL